MSPALHYVLWFLAALPVVLFILVLAVASTGHFSLERSIKRLSITPCPKCGKPFGRAAILAGRDQYASKVQEMIRQHSGIRFRLVAEWEIECPQCHTKVYFYPGDNRLETTSRRSEPQKPAATDNPAV